MAHRDTSVSALRRELGSFEGGGISSRISSGLLTRGSLTNRPDV